VLFMSGIYWEPGWLSIGMWKKTEKEKQTFLSAGDRSVDVEIEEGSNKEHALRMTPSMVGEVIGPKDLKKRAWYDPGMGDDEEDD